MMLSSEKLQNCLPSASLTSFTDLEWVVILQSEQIQPLLSQDLLVVWRLTDFFFFAVTPTQCNAIWDAEVPVSPVTLPFARNVTHCRNIWL